MHRVHASQQHVVQPQSSGEWQSVTWLTAGASLVDIALETGSLFASDGFKYIQPSFESGTVHLIGLCSDGGVHSRLDQVHSPHPLPLSQAHDAKRVSTLPASCYISSLETMRSTDRNLCLA